MRTLHYFSGLTLAVFIGIHVLNHLVILHSEELHVKLMNRLRKFYRHPLIETIILLAVPVQIFSGIALVISKWNKAVGYFEWAHLISGLYLAFFFAFHISAVMIGRNKLKLDTNLYYGAGVMNMWPQKLFFIPYYSFALLSFFFHVACVHRVKMGKLTSLSTATTQALIIMGIGVLVTALVIFKMSNLSSLKITTKYINRNQA